jgi:tetratricopeptide (TPR) repeat protein
MPPEQFGDGPVDARADQFAFCVALYEGLWGRRPFDEASLQARRLAAMRGPSKPPEHDDVPAWIWPVLARGLAHRPEDRWPSLTVLLDALVAASERRKRWRRRGVLGLALGVTAVAAGLTGASLWSTAAPSEPACAAEPDGLDAIWNSAARGALERTFMATELPWAEDASRRLHAALDAWGASWEAVRIELCEARRAGGDLLAIARQSACLEQRRLELAALLELLVRADAALVQRSLAAVGELGEPRSCVDDPSALSLAPAPPGAQRDAVNELGRALDGVEASIRTARYSEARDALAALAARVEQTGHEPLEARLLELRGRASLWSVDVVGGVAALERAADLAEGSRDDRELAEVWRYLALWALVEARDVNRGLPWLRRAEASARRIGVDPARSGELATLRGHHRLVLHELAQAEHEFRVAIADFEARGRTLRLLEARRALGSAQVQQGQLEAALETFRTALAEAELVTGPHHPIYASTAYNLGATLLGLGRADEARLNLRTAVSVWTESPGELRPDLGIAHLSLAGIALAAGRHAEAEHEIDRAEAILRATRPARHPDLGDVASARAAVAFARGDFPAARLALDQVVDIYREAFGPDDMYLAKVTAERGWVAIASGRIEDAERDFEAADAALRGNEELASLRESSLRGLAVVAGSRGRHKAALAWLGQVRVAACSPEALANYHLWSAVLHWRLGDREQARAHLVPGKPAVAEAERTGGLAAMHVRAAELRAIEAFGTQQQQAKRAE